MNVELIEHAALGATVFGACFGLIGWGWRSGAHLDRSNPDVALLRQAQRQGRLGVSMPRAAQMLSRGHSWADVLLHHQRRG